MIWLLSFIPDWLVHIAALVSLLGSVFLPGILSFIPELNSLKIFIIRAVLIVLVAFSFFAEGINASDARWEQKVAEQNVKIAQLETKAAEITNKVVADTAEKVENVKTVTKEIVKKVPVYITKEVDRNCDVPNSFVRLHDAAVNVQVPGAASVSDGDTSDVKLSTIAETVVENYGTCNETREKLIGLQDWVKQQKRLADGK